ncbi:MAG: peptidoglycan-binding domain-containing protein [Bacillota bacterium]
MKRQRIIITLLVAVFLLTSLTVVYADGILKKGDRGDEVTKLQSFLKEQGFFDEEATGYFGEVTEAAVMAFQKEYSIEADGIVGPLTLEALIAAGYDGSTFEESTSAVSSEGVEMLDWYKEVNKDAFKLNTIATVTDLWTGKQYKIVRTYGHNHADCETLTAEDTAIMKEIWGGKWSWERRPSIIEVDGRKIAASIAGMPHAGLDSKPANKTVSNRSAGYGKGMNLDKVKDNDMSGHFDVHFLNSRTHSTNRVDKKHQEMVKKAAGK